MNSVGVALRLRYWLAVGLVAAVAVIAVVSWVSRSSGITLLMRPVRPLSAAACAAEAHAHGYSMNAGRLICEHGSGSTWYRGVLTNHGKYALARCHATGYGASGLAVFSGPLVFDFGGPRGLFVPAHRTVSFTWYLPRRASAKVLSYTATCSGAPVP